jgi:hypothetical protein
MKIFILDILGAMEPLGIVKKLLEILQPKLLLLINKVVLLFLF